MITVNLPYDYGTFMKVLNEDKTVQYCGTVVAYTVVEDGWLVWVSGYKEAVTGEFEEHEIEVMTEEEIIELKKKYRTIEKIKEDDSDIILYKLANGTKHILCFSMQYDESLEIQDMVCKYIEENEDIVNNLSILTDNIFIYSDDSNITFDSIFMSEVVADPILPRLAVLKNVPTLVDKFSKVLENRNGGYNESKIENEI